MPRTAPSLSSSPNARARQPSLCIGAAALLGPLLALAACSADAEGNGVQGPAPGGSGSSGSGSGSGGDGSGIFGTDGPPASSGGGDTCGSVQLDATVEEVELPGNVLVIFDQSNSMTADFDTPNGVLPRWQAASQAVADAIAPVADMLTVGAILFPSSSVPLLCGAVVDDITSPTQINFRPGADFVQAWNDYWALGDQRLVLGTPLNRAFDAAAAGLFNAQLQGQTVVIVVGDGEPVCVEGVPAEQRAAEWFGLGIQTHVIGLPDASIVGGSALLTAIAANGGTGDFIVPTDSQQLAQQLSQIARTAITRGIDNCTITLDPPPEDPAQTFLVVEEGASAQRYQVPRDGAAGGWSIAADGTSATLTGSVCADAQSGRFTTVTFEFGCVDLPFLQ